MKTSLTVILITLISLVTRAQEDKIVSTWKTEEGTSHIRIFKATNGKYYGKIDWLEDSDELDENNPDASKRNVPLQGLIILKGFEYDVIKKQWTNGTIYDPDNGKTYDCFMWFENDPKILFIRGYIMGMKFMGRSTKWTLVE